MRWLLCLLLVQSLWANLYDFSYFERGDNNGTTILIIGGIQGDEPGGFNAASLLSTRYKIKNGSLRIVPNLNFESIIKRSRGVYGDMNRKFKTIKKTDPEYETVMKIKKLILDKKVDFVINLHDGSGFYRTKYIDKKRNSSKWGQSSIIDQVRIKGVKFGELEKIARFVVKEINKKSLRKEFNYRIKNTKTSQGNQEMLQSLTWFAVANNKPAFANEASKNFRTRTRVFYHLLAVEAFMRYAKISYERDFKLSPRSIEKAINDDVQISINKKLVFETPNTKSKINYVPLRKNGSQEVNATSPLATMIKNGKNYRLHYGNRRLGVLVPSYFEYDYNLSQIQMKIDNKDALVPFGKVIEVKKNFLVHKQKDYRVNIIGFVHKHKKDESDLVVTKKQLNRRFSVDKSGKKYRVEVYETKTNKFAGMVLVKFSSKPINVSR